MATSQSILQHSSEFWQIMLTLSYVAHVQPEGEGHLQVLSQMLYPYVSLFSDLSFIYFENLCKAVYIFSILMRCDCELRTISTPEN